MKNHRFRAILAQAVAVTIKNLLLLDLGVSSAFPVILVPALTGLSSATNPNETIRITASEASWLGSTATMLTIFGSAVSGILTDPIGRKKAMLIVNIPHIFGWFLLYYSTSLVQVFIGMSLLGLGVGLMEAPVITYVGEICEASVRDVMISTSGISATTGIIVVFLAGSWLDWRTVALICSCIPIAGAVLLLFVPETPIWLLSRNRDDEASKSLQWLRGWVAESEIEKELNELKVYRDFANACSDCRTQKIKCTHPLPSLPKKIQALFQASYMRPMIIVTIAAVFSSFAGIHHLSPYLVQILNTYESPITPAETTIWFGMAALVGMIAYMLVAKIYGKRSLYMVSIALTAVFNLWLGIHGLYYLPPNSKSYEHADEVLVGPNASYIPLVLVALLRVLNNALLIIPVMYESELFPLQSRCIAAGIAEGFSYSMLFIATKTFYNLEYWLNMPVAFCIYGVIGVIGICVSYKIFPATEGRTLEEIEKHFTDPKNKLTDWSISKNRTSS